MNILGFIVLLVIAIAVDGPIHVFTTGLPRLQDLSPRQAERVPILSTDAVPSCVAYHVLIS